MRVGRDVSRPCGVLVAVQCVDLLGRHRAVREPVAHERRIDVGCHELLFVSGYQPLEGVALDGVGVVVFGRCLGVECPHARADEVRELVAAHHDVDVDVLGVVAGVGLGQLLIAEARRHCDDSLRLADVRKLRSERRVADHQLGVGSGQAGASRRLTHRERLLGNISEIRAEPHHSDDQRTSQCDEKLHDCHAPRLHGMAYAIVEHGTSRSRYDEVFRCTLVQP